MDKQSQNRIIPRLSEAIGRELAKSGSADAQAAFKALGVLSHLGVDFLNIFLIDLRKLLGKLDLKDISTATERKSLKAEGKLRATKQNISKAKNTIVENFTAQRDLYKMLSNQVEAINPRQQKTIEESLDRIYTLIWEQLTQKHQTNETNTNSL